MIRDFSFRDMRAIWTSPTAEASVWQVMEEMSGPVTRSRTSSLVSLEAGPSTSPPTEEVVRTRVRLVESATSGFGDEPKKKKVNLYAYWHIWGCLFSFLIALFFIPNCTIFSAIRRQNFPIRTFWYKRCKIVQKENSNLHKWFGSKIMRK